MNAPQATRLTLIAVAVIAAVSLIGCTNAADNAAPETTIDVAAVRPVQVFVFDTFVPKGADAETIRAAISVKTIPSRLENPGGVVDLAELDGMVTAIDMEPGDQLLAGRLVPAD
jgi:pilus assembly protein CpaB